MEVTLALVLIGMMISRLVRVEGGASRREPGDWRRWRPLDLAIVAGTVLFAAVTVLRFTTMGLTWRVDAGAAEPARPAMTARRSGPV